MTSTLTSPQVRTIASEDAVLRRAEFRARTEVAAGVTVVAADTELPRIAGIVADCLGGGIHAARHEMRGLTGPDAVHHVALILR